MGFPAIQHLQNLESFCTKLVTCTCEEIIDFLNIVGSDIILEVCLTVHGIVSGSANMWGCYEGSSYLFTLRSLDSDAPKSVTR